MNQDSGQDGLGFQTNLLVVVLIVGIRRLIRIKRRDSVQKEQKHSEIQRRKDLVVAGIVRGGARVLEITNGGVSVVVKADVVGAAGRAQVNQEAGDIHLGDLKGEGQKPLGDAGVLHAHDDAGRGGKLVPSHVGIEVGNDIRIFIHHLVGIGSGAKETLLLPRPNTEPDGVRELHSTPSNNPGHLHHASGTRAVIHSPRGPEGDITGAGRAAVIVGSGHHDGLWVLRANQISANVIGVGFPVGLGGNIQTQGAEGVDEVGLGLLELLGGRDPGVVVLAQVEDEVLQVG